MIPSVRGMFSNRPYMLYLLFRVPMTLAALLPWCTVTIVDVKRKSLDLAEARAKQAGLRNVRT